MATHTLLKAVVFLVILIRCYHTDFICGDKLCSCRLSVKGILATCKATKLGKIPNFEQYILKNLELVDMRGTNVLCESVWSEKELVVLSNCNDIQDTLPSTSKEIHLYKPINNMVWSKDFITLKYSITQRSVEKDYVTEILLDR